jgi:hypothetical protein
MFSLRVQEAWKNLAVTKISRSYSVSANATMVDIDTQTVLVAVATDLVPLGPALA